jgi:glycosyltransferase involved in cell wall biosynthesis
MVITPGEGVRKQVIERFRVRPDRVVAVPEAPAPWLRRVEPEPSAWGPYFLFVGTLEPRKNIPALLDAWRVARRRQAVELVIAGRRRADFEPLQEEPGLHIVGEVPDQDLPALYSGALALIYPSLYEGFGLPVLEAMQCGAPVIASRAVAEVAGDAAIYADTAEELARAMSGITAASVRDEYRARSLARAREFTWERTARLTYEVYREARRRFGA